jgi:hypothetical protein
MSMIRAKVTSTSAAARSLTLRPIGLPRSDECRFMEYVRVRW